MHKIIFTAFLCVLPFLGISQEHFALQLKPIREEVPNLCYITESKYFENFSLENWPVYRVNRDAYYLEEVGELQTQPSEFLESKKAFLVTYSEGKSYEPGNPLFVFIQPQGETGLEQGKLFELATFAIYINDVTEQPITDFYTCYTQGINDADGYRKMLDDLQLSASYLPDSLLDLEIPFGKFSGKTVRQVASGLQAGDVENLVDLMDENFLLYMGEYIQAGDLILEWILAGSPVSQKWLIQNTLWNPEKSDSIAEANRVQINDQYWEDVLAEMFFWNYGTSDSTQQALKLAYPLNKKYGNVQTEKELQFAEARSLLVQGNAPAAQKILKTLEKYYKKEQSLMKQELISRDLAETYRVSGDLKKALKTMLPWKKTSASPGYFEELAMLYQENKSWEDCIASYLRAVELYGENEPARTAYIYNTLASICNGLQMEVQAQEYRQLERLWQEKLMDN